MWLFANNRNQTVGCGWERGAVLNVFQRGYRTPRSPTTSAWALFSSKERIARRK